MRGRLVLVALVLSACTSVPEPAAPRMDPSIDPSSRSPTTTSSPPSSALTVETGVEVPFMLFGTLGEAKRTLRGLGLKLKVIYVADDFMPAGTILAQSPDSGTVKDGKVIKLTVVKETPCSPSYPDVCIPPLPPDLDCADVPFKNIRVIPPDPHGFDGYDNDGWGCET